MNDALRAAAAPAVVPDHERGTSTHAWWLAAPGRTLERERLEHRAGQTAAAAQLRRCLPRWTRMLEQLTSQALTRLAKNQPIDLNDPDTWRNRRARRSGAPPPRARQGQRQPAERQPRSAR